MFGMAATRSSRSELSCARLLTGCSPHRPTLGELSDRAAAFSSLLISSAMASGTGALRSSPYAARSCLPRMPGSTCWLRPRRASPVAAVFRIGVSGSGAVDAAPARAQRPASSPGGRSRRTTFPKRPSSRRTSAALPPPDHRLTRSGPLVAVPGPYAGADHITHLVRLSNAQLENKFPYSLSRTQRKARDARFRRHGLVMPLGGSWLRLSQTAYQRLIASSSCFLATSLATP